MDEVPGCRPGLPALADKREQLITAAEKAGEEWVKKADEANAAEDNEIEAWSRADAAETTALVEKEIAKAASAEKELARAAEATAKAATNAAWAEEAKEHYVPHKRRSDNERRTK